ncbi:uncharacterized protein LOC134531389 [Bacillus rossius redtenbacheri]|uniref:uncharacterized protein LOC134531389 n=1 Tax=Bacillus rossius redtenbacheri TaxID=93214 RepID=UPI002FDEF0DB
MKPIWMVSRAFGLEPFQIILKTLSDGTIRLKPKYSVKKTLHTYAVIFIMIVSFFISATRNKETFHESINVPGPKLQILRLLNLVSRYMAALVSVTGMYMHGKSRLEIYQTFMEVDEMLSKHSRVNYRNWSKCCARHLAIMIFTLLAFTIASTVFATLHRDGSLRIIIQIVHFITDFVVFTTTASYINLILLIYQRLKLINEALQTHFDLIVMRVKPSTVNYFRRSTLNYIQESPQRPKNMIMNLNNRNSVDEGLLSDERARLIHSMRRIYNKIYQISLIINKVYGVIVLFSIFSTFVTITLSLYFGLKAGFGSITSPNDFNQKFQATTFFTWSLAYVVKTFAMLWACNASTNETKRINDRIHHSLIHCGQEQEKKTALKEFSSQITDCGMAFSGSGIITLDMPLLASMMGSVMSYLLVLLQLNPSETPR